MANKKFTIDCEIPDRWVNDFCSFLRQLEYKGNIGHSSLIGFYADGDGDFRPKFTISTDWERTEGIWNKPGNKLYAPEVLFDAG